MLAGLFSTKRRRFGAGDSSTTANSTGSFTAISLLHASGSNELGAGRRGNVASCLNLFAGDASSAKKLSAMASSSSVMEKKTCSPSNSSKSSHGTGYLPEGPCLLREQKARQKQEFRCPEHGRKTRPSPRWTYVKTQRRLAIFACGSFFCPKNGRVFQPSKCAQPQTFWPSPERFLRHRNSRSWRGGKK